MYYYLIGVQVNYSYLIQLFFNANTQDMLTKYVLVHVNVQHNCISILPNCHAAQVSLQTSVNLYIYKLYIIPNWCAAAVHSQTTASLNRPSIIAFIVSVLIWLPVLAKWRRSVELNSSNNYCAVRVHDGQLGLNQFSEQQRAYPRALSQSLNTHIYNYTSNIYIFAETYSNTSALRLCLLHIHEIAFSCCIV